MKFLLLLAWLGLLLACGRFSARADVIARWNTLMLQAIRNETTPPPLAARNLAILHTSIHDALNAIVPGYEPYLVSLTPAPGASLEAAVTGAAHECLSELYPGQMASFDAALNDFLANTPDTQSRSEGLALGYTAALLTLVWRSADGASTSVPYIPSSEPGAWRRTPPFFRPPELPQWPYVTPFAMTNGAQFRPAGPPSLTSAQYAAEFNQVKQLGRANSTQRTSEQTLIARFWSDFSYTATPPGHWNYIAQNVVTNRPSTLLDNARLFAWLNIAMADAAICVWDAKYAYNFWRPVTAIQQGDTDGNADTEGDPEWLPLLNTPAFPEYVSGHAAFSSAAAVVLASFCGTDAVNFAVESDTVIGVTRSYQSFAACADEIAMSRIYGGIHFYSADVDGLSAGRLIGDYVIRSFLRPVPPRLTITRRSSPAAPRIDLIGTAGVTHVLEISTNLLQWTPVITNISSFTFEPSPPENASMLFYRAFRFK